MAVYWFFNSAAKLGGDHMDSSKTITIYDVLCVWGNIQVVSKKK